MNITQEQKDLLSLYDIETCDDINAVLLALDDKITEIGFGSDYALNENGRVLQQLYDNLYNQN